MSEKASTQYELQSHLLASIGAWADQFAHGPTEGPGFNYLPMNDLMCSHCDPIAALQGGPYAYKPSPEIDLEPLERFLVEWRDRPIQESLLLLTTQFEELKNWTRATYQDLCWRLSSLLKSNLNELSTAVVRNGTSILVRNRARHLPREFYTSLASIKWIDIMDVEDSS